MVDANELKEVVSGLLNENRTLQNQINEMTKQLNKEKDDKRKKELSKEVQKLQDQLISNLAKLKKMSPEFTSNTTKDMENTPLVNPSKMDELEAEMKRNNEEIKRRREALRNK